jgi:hypothetical protein
VLKSACWHLELLSEIGIHCSRFTSGCHGRDTIGKVVYHKRVIPTVYYEIMQWAPNTLHPDVSLHAGQ